MLDANDLLITDKDREIWNRLITDLNRPHDVPKAQVMRLWEGIYSKWFSRDVHIYRLQKLFEQEVIKSEKAKKMNGIGG